MASVTTREIPHLWAQQSDATRSKGVAAVSFEGPTLYSYSTPIASFARDKKGEPLTVALPFTWNESGSIDESGHWVDGAERSEIRTLPVVLRTHNTFSNTTSKHQSGVWSALGYGANCIAHVFTVASVVPGSNGRGTHAPHDYAEFHAHNLVDYAARIVQADAAAQKARKPQIAAGHAVQAERLIQEAQRYAKAFGVKWAWKGAEAERKRIEREAKKAAKVAAQARAESMRREAERMAHIRELNAADFAAWVRGESYHVPHGYRADPLTGGAYMRRVTRDGVELLETSQGASVPWAHAVRVFQFIRKVRETGKPFHTNGRVVRVGLYKVDSIDADGNMRAGCHYFTWSQIADIAKREGVFNLEPSSEVVESAS